jgi:succinoglycan biosynthesis transport protein ExoP
MALVPGEEVRAREEPGLAIAAYWNLILKHKFGIVGLAVVCGLMAALVAYSLEPLYQAQVTLLLDTKRKGFSPVQDQADGGWMSYFDSQTYVQTQILLLESRALAESVSVRLRLWDDAEFDPRQAKPRRAHIQVDWRSWLPDLFPESEAEPPPTEAQAKAATIAAVAGRLKAEAIPDSEVIRLSFTANDPALAARVANAYADAYVEMGLETRLQAVSKAATWLTGRLDGMREKVETSERKLQAYREAHGLVDMDGALDLTDKQLGGLSDRLVEARGRRDDLQGLYEQMQRAGKLSNAELVSHPNLARNATIQSLKASELGAEREVSELAKRYGPAHPKMVAARSDLDTVRSKLNAEIGNAVAGVKKDLDIAQAQADKLEDEFEALKTTAQDVNRQEFSLRSLKRDVETDRQLYDMFLTRFKETDLGTDVESTNARVIDVAEVPTAPIKPNAARIIAISSILALMAGIGLALLIEYLDNTLKSAQDVEESLQVPMLGMIPLLSGRRRKKTPPERMFTDQPKSEFAEAIRTLRTGVVLSSVDEPHRVVLLTSSVPGEGKTTIAVNLAMALGHLDKVLLIDADMRRASVGSKFGLPTDAPGLSNLVAGTAEEDACIHRVEGVNIDILPAGLLPPNPLELLSSRRFVHILERLRERYDRLVIDSAPAQAVSDSLILSKACDAVVFVIHADETPLPLVQIAVKRLRQVGAPLIGAVLNQYDGGRGARYGHYHYGKYRRHSYAYNAYASYYRQGND